MKLGKKAFATFGVTALLAAGALSIPAAAHALEYKGCPPATALKITSTKYGPSGSTNHGIQSGTSVATGASYSNNWTYASGATHKSTTGAVSGNWYAVFKGDAIHTSNAFC